MFYIYVLLSEIFQYTRKLGDSFHILANVDENGTPSVLILNEKRET